MALQEYNFSRLEHLLAALPESERYHAPAAALDRVRILFRERYPAPAAAPAPAFVPLVARLVFNSLGQRTPALARGAGSTTVQLLYETADYDIDLFQEQDAAGTWYLIGQVLSQRGEADFWLEKAVLLSEGTEPIRATRESGEFHFAGVRPGRYTLRSQVCRGTMQEEIIMPELTVGPDLVLNEEGFLSGSHD